MIKDNQKNWYEPGGISKLFSFGVVRPFLVKKRDFFGPPTYWLRASRSNQIAPLTLFYSEQVYMLGEVSASFG